MKIAELIKQGYPIDLPISGRTGNSLEKALVIEKPNVYTDFKDVEDEYLTIVCKYRGKSWRRFSEWHSTIYDNRYIRVVYIDTFEDRETDNLIQREVFYFDITAY